MCQLDFVYSYVAMKRGYMMRDHIDTITNQRKIAEKEIFDITRKLAHGTTHDEKHILESSLNGAKARKGLFKLMNNSLSGKTSNQMKSMVILLL